MVAHSDKLGFIRSPASIPILALDSLALQSVSTSFGNLKYQTKQQ